MLWWDPASGDDSAAMVIGLETGAVGVRLRSPDRDGSDRQSRPVDRGE